jgi:hypothetical protein
MATSEIIKIDNRINYLRLELIRIIARINRTLASIPKATRTAEYLALKTEYQQRKEEIYCLGILKKELSAKIAA